MCVRAVAATWPIGAACRLVCSIATTTRDTKDERSVGRAGEYGLEGDVGMFVVDGDDGYDWVGIGVGEDGLVLSRVEITLLSIIKPKLPTGIHECYSRPPAREDLRSRFRNTIACEVWRGL